MNSFLLDFVRKQENRAKQIEPPNPQPMPKRLPSQDAEALTFSQIVDEKPPSKKVCEYLKKRINEIYEEKD